MKKLTIYQMSICAIMAALMCVLGPLSIPIGPVPVSLTNLVIYFAVMVLGTRYASISYVVYLLLGTVGLPVFSGFQGGVAKLAGPTGGYLIGFILMAIVCGLFAGRFKDKPAIICVGMFLGTLLAYAFGTTWFMFMMKCGLWYSLTICVFPFIPFDIGKIIVAVIIGGTVHKSLSKAGMLAEKK